MVKGRARHPQSQGGIEQGNGPFQMALQKDMHQDNSVFWAEQRIYVVQCQLNKRPSRSKGNLSPYEGFFGKLLKDSPLNMLGANLLRQCRTEGGSNAAYDLVKGGDSVPDENILMAIQEGDMNFVKNKAL